MVSRTPVTVVLIGFAVGFGFVIALAGCVGLGVPGLVVCAVSAAFAAATAGAVLGRQHRSAAVRGAGTAATWTAAILLLISGIDALAGAVVATVTGSLTALGVAAWWMLRRRGAFAAGRLGFASHRRSRSSALREPEIPARLRNADASVCLLSTAQLGHEWLLSTAVLARPLDPFIYQSMVRRRSEALDELERRDPVGFARWLRESYASGDPAEFVRASSPPPDG